MTPLLAQTAADVFANNFGYVIAAVIIVIGLSVGLKDLTRLSFRRFWAIGSVGFRESMRRRVLWVTPLAMLGIIAVSQLSHPADEQDAIRQTTKYCLFASGIVVVIATLLMACTSLPKEIDNRVIYTIVTKPATRLEIVLGKTIGFARTSAAILLVMGLFSYAYLRVNAAQLGASIRARLATLPPTDTSRDTLRHYADEGLLQARTYARPAGIGWATEPGLQIYARVPEPTDPYRWIFGSNEHNVIFPFEFDDSLIAGDDANLIFTIEVATRQPRPLNRRELENEAPDPTATTRPSTQGVQRWPGPPRINVTLLNENYFTTATPNDLVDALHMADFKPRPGGSEFKTADSIVLEKSATPNIGQAVVVVPPKAIQQRIRTTPPGPDGKRRLYLMLVGLTPATEFGLNENSVKLNAQVQGVQGAGVGIAPPKGPEGKPAQPVFRTRTSSAHLQQLRGDANPADAPLAVFRFRAPDFAPAGDTVPFEFRTKVERSGSDNTGETDDPTVVEIAVHNNKTGRDTAPLSLTVDSDRPTFFRAPRAGVEGGDFDVIARSRTPGHYVGLRPGSVAVAASSHSFAFNLFKSLVILWLLSVLVVIISVFCSTFVSWPIAVVLTLVILLGRWCVVQLGEPASPQQMATDFFGASANPVQTRVFTDTMGALNKLLTITAKVLPDLDQFRVTEDIERGVTIPWRGLTDPLLVLFTFGIPVTILAYVLLRRKEVAP